VDELGRLRVRTGHTYKDLEKHTGIPHSTLCDTLTGKRRPRQHVVEKIVHTYADGAEQAAEWMDTWAGLVAGQHIGVEETSLVPAGRNPRPDVQSVLLWCVVGFTAIAAGVSATASLWPRHQGRSTEIQEQIDRQLLRIADGERINRREVSYNDGRFVIGFDSPGHRDATTSDCPAGWVCFYEHRNYGWPRARLRACGWSDLGWWDWNDRVESVRNDTGSNLTFINHDDHGIAAHGHRLDRPLFRMGPYQQLTAVPGAPTPPEQADHVIRTCAQ
jgi:hypothetical protein